MRIDSSRQRVRELIAQDKCDVVLLDFDSCPAAEQFDFMTELHAEGAPVVVLTDCEGIPGSCRKRAAGAELTNALRNAYDHRKLKRDDGSELAQTTASQCGEMVGKATGSRLVYDRIRRVADVRHLS